MAYEAKMKPTDKDVHEFIDGIEKDRKREDARILVDLFEEISGYPPVMWGESMIGYGQYHYEYASGHKGTAFRTGFAPGKSNRMSLYVLIPYSDVMDSYLERLGKHKSGKACLYINKLADVDMDVLREIIEASVNYMNEKYPEDA